MEREELEQAYRVEYMDRDGSFRLGIIDRINKDKTVTLRRYGYQKKKYKTKDGYLKRMGWHIRERVPFRKIFKVLRKKRKGGDNGGTIDKEGIRPKQQ